MISVRFTGDRVNSEVQTNETRMTNIRGENDYELMRSRQHNYYNKTSTAMQTNDSFLYERRTGQPLPIEKTDKDIESINETEKIEQAVVDEVSKVTESKSMESHLTQTDASYLQDALALELQLELETEELKVETTELEQMPPDIPALPSDSEELVTIVRDKHLRSDKISYPTGFRKSIEQEPSDRLAADESAASRMFRTVCESKQATADLPIEQSTKSQEKCLCNVESVEMEYISSAQHCDIPPPKQKVSPLRETKPNETTQWHQANTTCFCVDDEKDGKLQSPEYDCDCAPVNIEHIETSGRFAEGCTQTENTQVATCHLGTNTSAGIQKEGACPTLTQLTSNFRNQTILSPKELHKSVASCNTFPQYTKAPTCTCMLIKQCYCSEDTDEYNSCESRSETSLRTAVYGEVCKESIHTCSLAIINPCLQEGVKYNNCGPCFTESLPKVVQTDKETSTDPVGPCADAPASEKKTQTETTQPESDSKPEPKPVQLTPHCCNVSILSSEQLHRHATPCNTAKWYSIGPSTPCPLITKYGCLQESEQYESCESDSESSLNVCICDEKLTTISMSSKPKNDSKTCHDPPNEQNESHKGLSANSLNLSCGCIGDAFICKAEPEILCRRNTPRLDKIVRLLRQVTDHSDKIELEYKNPKLIEELFVEITCLLKRNSLEKLATSTQDFNGKRLSEVENVAEQIKKDDEAAGNEQIVAENSEGEGELKIALEQVVLGEENENNATQNELKMLSMNLVEIEVALESNKTEEERNEHLKRLLIDEQCLRKLREYIRACFCNVCNQLEEQIYEEEQDECFWNEEQDECHCVEEELLAESDCIAREHDNCFDNFNGDQSCDRICQDNFPCKKAYCNCCHCRAAKDNCKSLAQITAASIDPVAEMKYFVDSLIFDMEATEQAIRANRIRPKKNQKRDIEHDIRNSYPATITEVTRLGMNSLYVRWKLLECYRVAGYELYLDGHLTNRLYSVCHDSAVIAEVNVSKVHQITLRVQPEDEDFAGDNDAPNTGDGGDCIACNYALNVGTSKGAERSWIPSIYLYDPQVSS